MAIPFLKELAEKALASGQPVEQMTFIFPNRRAALYFERHLAESLQKPAWAPRLHSIEAYFRIHSKLQEPDKLTLVHKLYQVYSEVMGSKEPLDRFFFWGEMLLRDFDEIDKYMVNGVQLFRDLSRMKELDETFDYLTEEQKKFLRDFWIHFQEKESVTKESFLQLWRRLGKVYSSFTKALKAEGVGYEGMIHREVAERWMKKPLQRGEGVWIAGFNALTKAEATIIYSLVADGARLVWDADQHYLNDPNQEAGQFMRQYRDHTRLASTFAAANASGIVTNKKKIVLTGVAQKIGQAKQAGEQVRGILNNLPERVDLARELAKTVIVLPDESMLLPVLHSLPEEIKDINVTMGFPLRETPMFHLLDLMIEMQVKRRKETVNHREVIGLLSHAYCLSLVAEEAASLRQQVIERNRVFVNLSDLQGGDEYFKLAFRAVEPANATKYLLEMVALLGARFNDKRNFDREFAYHFYQQLARLESILGSDAETDWRGFQKLFRQVVLSHKIPFTGEPLRGLQIMGTLETRNLDFDNVIFLSLNEGKMPAGSTQGTYIPHAVRKAYGLPGNDHRDAIYAYLFYRLLQRTQNVWWYYNTEPDILGDGELSRFVQQVLLEMREQLPVERRLLHHPVHIQPPVAISIDKTETVLHQLNRFVIGAEGYAGKLTPTNLNDYIECRLRFYLTHVVGLAVAEEVDEEVDSRAFGNIVHEILFWFYKDLSGRREGQVLPEDFDDVEDVVDGLIEKAFRQEYQLREGEDVTYEGQRVIIRHVSKSFILKVLQRDAEYAPFTLGWLEQKFHLEIQLADGRNARLEGKIDRTDEKDGVVRIIDYKTGRDTTDFARDSLFHGEKKRNKAAFQTLLYAAGFENNQKPSGAIMPGLYNRSSIFNDTFRFGLTMDKEILKDARPFLPVFQQELEELVHEIWDPKVPFDQTTYVKNCEYCLFRQMCRR